MKLIETGIPVSKAQFHAAVNNADQVPENYFSCHSAVKSRQVKMWWTPHTLICHQKDKYWGVPISTVIFANFINMDTPEIQKALNEVQQMQCEVSGDSGLAKLTPPIAAPKKRGRPFKNKEV